MIIYNIIIFVIYLKECGTVKNIIIIGLLTALKFTFSVLVLQEVIGGRKILFYCEYK